MFATRTIHVFYKLDFYNKLYLKVSVITVHWEFLRAIIILEEEWIVFRLYCPRVEEPAWAMTKNMNLCPLPTFPIPMLAEVPNWVMPSCQPSLVNRSAFKSTLCTCRLSKALQHLGQHVCLKAEKPISSRPNMFSIHILDTMPSLLNLQLGSDLCFEHWTNDSYLGWLVNDQWVMNSPHEDWRVGQTWLNWIEASKKGGFCESILFLFWKA